MRVAIVGAGIAGLSAARALAGRAEVELFEAGARAGGHVHTVELDGVAVDLGFIVCNRATYPHFMRLLDQLGVATRPTTMSFSVRIPDEDHEWGSADLRALFAQPRNVLSGRHWRFLRAVIGFLRDGRRDLGSGLTRRASLDEYLAVRRVSADVRERFVVPLAAALWSLAPARCGGFPAETYLRFLHQHGMLRPLRPLPWHTIVGGSQRYVEALLATLPARVHLGTAVTSVRRARDGVTVLVGGRERRFDRVVLATHADTALHLLDADPDERAVLGGFGYSDNDVVLHDDVSYLPRAPRARASWNYVADGDGSRVAVTYWMNRLQGLAGPPRLVTLNPGAPIAGARHAVRFRHPQFDAAALRAQAAMGAIQGRGGVYHAGAHLGFGFHEDGVRTGLAAAARLLADGEHVMMSAREAR